MKRNLSFFEDFHVKSNTDLTQLVDLKKLVDKVWTNSRWQDCSNPYQSRFPMSMPLQALSSQHSQTRHRCWPRRKASPARGWLWDANRIIPEDSRTNRIRKIGNFAKLTQQLFDAWVAVGSILHKVPNCANLMIRRGASSRSRGSCSSSRQSFSQLCSVLLEKLTCILLILDFALLRARACAQTGLCFRSVRTQSA
eukprot:SAG31_NODE_5254_length_2647_cov_2.073783_1_plen_195_part_10